jgi:hypothetical protein
MKQRMVSALLLGSLVLGSLAGCGGSGSAGTAATGTPASGGGTITAGTGQAAGGTPAGDSSAQPPAGTSVAKLTWSAIPEGAAGFKVYYGRTPGVYDSAIDVGMAVGYDFSNLAPGTYYFSVTAYDVTGSESPFSNEVSKNIG